MNARLPAPASLLLPVAALVAGMISIQSGAALAKMLFPVVGAAGVTALRVGFSAVILLGLWRPWRRGIDRRSLGTVALYGAALGAMNLLFYLALRTVPLGLAVAIEFVGPLGVALVGSRRAIDLAWIGLAVLGLALLLPREGTGAGTGTIDPLGAGLALAAGLAWALYIVVGQRAGRAGGGQAVSLGMSTAALLTAPFGLAEGGSALFVPSTLLAGLAVAVLSSALPYSLEMIALQRMRREAIGVMMSLEPAIAALSGAAILGERLRPAQWLALACVIAASAGITLSSRRTAS